MSDSEGSNAARAPSVTSTRSEGPIAAGRACATPINSPPSPAAAPACDSDSEAAYAPIPAEDLPDIVDTAVADEHIAWVDRASAPPKRKRGRPSKADIMLEQVLADKQEPPKLGEVLCRPNLLWHNH